MTEQNDGMEWRKGRREEKKMKKKEKSGERMKMSTDGDLPVLQSAAVAIITGENNIKQLGLNFSIPVTEWRQAGRRAKIKTIVTHREMF